MAKKFIISHYHHNQEVEHRVCSATEVADFLSQANKDASKGWRWGLSDSNFWNEDGTMMNYEERIALIRESKSGNE